MAHRDIVVIGASAGGLQALTTIVAGLPPTLTASVLVVVHTGPGSNGVLPDVLSRVSALPVAFASDREPLVAGRIYVARPDMQLLVTKRELRVLHGPRENGFRPAVDPLFRTAARTFGPRVIGVILSGALDDGTYGLSVVKHLGGVAVVQDPEDAMIPSMPASAIRHVDVDRVLAAPDIAAAIVELSAERVKDRAMARHTEREPQLPTEPSQVSDMRRQYGDPSTLTCPECGGSLWEIEEGRVTRYQCHTGHLYAPESLQAEQRDAVDGALWSAVRVLEEHAELKTRMARRASDSGLALVASTFEQGAQDAHGQAQRIRSLLFGAVAAAISPSENGTPAASGTRPRRSRKAKSRPSRRRSTRPGRK